MSWDGLAVGARWPCGHKRDEENTQRNRSQAPRCKECHRARARDWWERHKNDYRPDEDEVIEGEIEMKEDELAAWAREELTRLGAWGIKGDEFGRARRRYTGRRIR